MEHKKVVVKGDGKNLYKVSCYSDGTYSVYHVESVAPIAFLDTEVKIGESNSWEDVLALIQSHSNRDIESVSSW